MKHRIPALAFLLALLLGAQGQLHATTHSVFTRTDRLNIGALYFMFPTDSTIQEVSFYDFGFYGVMSREELADSASLSLYDPNYGITGWYAPSSTNLLYENNKGGIWTVKEAVALDFSQALDLTDTSQFAWASSTHVVGNAIGTRSNKTTIVFKIHNGNYALCHSVGQDTSYWESNANKFVTTYTYIDLACQVQDDGTAKFDSIPQYPHETSALIPIPTVRATASPLPSRFYGVDGSRINVQRRVFPYQREYRP